VLFFQADLADLAADRDGHLPGLQAADEAGKIGANLRVQVLLLFERRPAQVDEGRAVDIDIVEPGRQRLGDEVADGLGFGLGVGGVLFGRCLEVVALNEEGPRKPSRRAAARTAEAYSEGRWSV